MCQPGPGRFYSRGLSATFPQQTQRADRRSTKPLPCPGPSPAGIRPGFPGAAGAPPATVPTPCPPSWSDAPSRCNRDRGPPGPPPSLRSSAATPVAFSSGIPDGRTATASVALARQSRLRIEANHRPVDQPAAPIPVYEHQYADHSGRRLFGSRIRSWAQPTAETQSSIKELESGVLRPVREPSLRSSSRSLHCLRSTLGPYRPAAVPRKFGNPGHAFDIRRLGIRHALFRIGPGLAVGAGFRLGIVGGLAPLRASCQRGRVRERPQRACERCHAKPAD